MSIFHRREITQISTATTGLVFPPTRLGALPVGGADQLFRGGARLGQRLRPGPPQNGPWSEEGDAPLANGPVTGAVAQVVGPVLHQDAGRRPAQQAMMIGPWGGRGGTPRDIRKGGGGSERRPTRLESVTVRSTDSYGGRINGFSFVYVDSKGRSVPVGTWGSATKGHEDTITMGPGGEYVNHVSGTADEHGVTSLTFMTNTGVQYGPYGYPTGTPFSLTLPQGSGGVVGFFGRSGDFLVALGLYVAAHAA